MPGNVTAMPVQQSAHEEVVSRLGAHGQKRIYILSALSVAGDGYGQNSVQRYIIWGKWKRAMSGNVTAMSAMSGNIQQCKQHLSNVNSQIGNITGNMKILIFRFL
ncbi:hypothetical protein BDQ17DRAFT_1339830 [Cyathus striatus]|nr:hypothetical protein BDQ17DRAFT_1339830 [Cyathus striatus]